MPIAHDAPKSISSSVSSIADLPYTPTKSTGFFGHARKNTEGAPQYPFTPDSARDAPTKTRPKALTRISDPYTPTKSFSDDGAQPHDPNGPLQYPYTPDSARASRTFSFPSADFPTRPHLATSPVQKALSSCILTLETLVKTREPDDEQMEYIVAQIEALASSLSSPESGSRDGEESIFPDLARQLRAAGLGISGASGIDSPLRSRSEERAKSKAKAKSAEEAEGAHYISEVETYIQGVRKHTEDLKMRMEEIKQLNSIQLEVIDDLRKELRARDEEMPTIPEADEVEGELEASEQPISDIDTPAVDIADDETSDADTLDSDMASKASTPGAHAPKQGLFWGAVGGALDAVSEMLYEW